MVYWGHAPNSQTRGTQMVEAMKKLDLMVVIDPYPSATAAMCAMVRKDGVYLLPASTQFETSGSVTASNRSLQWREKVIEPLFESKPDHTLMVAFADKFGFKKELINNYQMVKDKDGWDEPTPESILKEINAGTFTIGYSGQSPERLKLHMKNMSTFDVKSLRARGGPCDGDYFGLPWPCYGTPGTETPRFAQPVSDVTACDGRRRLLPRQLRRRARRRVRCLRRTARTRRAAISPPAIPNSTTFCSRNWAGGTNSPMTKRRRPKARTGRRIVPAASSASR